MALADDILALSPSLYWKLDDPTGPAASDSSGRGHPGAYGGSFSLGMAGPEPNTHAAFFAPGGRVECTGMPQLVTAPFSFMWYESRNTIATPANGTGMHHGDVNSRRGWYFNLNTGDGTQMYVWMGNSGNFPLNNQVLPVWNKWWHAFAVTFNPPNNFVMYIDGAQVTTGQPYAAFTPAFSDDLFGFSGVYQHVLAHIAYFDRLLTVAQIQQLHGYRVNWPFGPMINAVLGSGGASGPVPIDPADPVIVSIDQDLSDIRAAVIRTYPPTP